MRPLTSRIGTVLAVLGALSYPVLLLFILGTSFSPFNPESSWGLAAEHGEMEFEHWSQFIVAIVAAVPAAISFKIAAHRAAIPLLLAASVIAALPYAVQPTHSFAASDSWLANYTWQAAAVEVTLAPLLVAATIEALAWLNGCAR